MGMGKRKVVFLLVAVLAVVVQWSEGSHCSTNRKFYKYSCPKAESIVRSTVQRATRKNPGVPAALLRMHFHDCFVRGCDASILVEGNNTEKASFPNLSLHEFQVINDAKTQIENECPGVVSCADILAYVARDSVVLTKGPFWEVPGGRKDGNVSRFVDPLTLLPPFNFTVPLLTTVFKNVGLNTDDMVILSGGHTIGISHCVSFINRLYNFNATFDIDPALNPRLAKQLRQVCPRGNPNRNTTVAMDNTPTKFDNKYFKALLVGKGLFISDQSLFLDPTTTKLVRSFACNEHLFRRRFIDSMIKMSLINVLTGSQGNIRKDCRAFNS